MSARRLWFQVHKWVGLLLAILTIPISVSGATLVWHDWLDETLNPSRYAVTGEPALAPTAYAETAALALKPGERIATLTYPDGEGPVLVSAARPTKVGASGRPVRTNIWLDPKDGRTLDVAGSDEGAVRVLHVLHGSLMVPGVGRQIVGWVGVAMLLSCLSGLWLWWPTAGRWTRGLRWRRQNGINANLHHQAGFWIVIPLAMLSFTGVWISFPQFFNQFTTAPAAQPNAGPDRERQMRARPLDTTKLTPEAALRAAQTHAKGPLASIAWPTDQQPDWRISFRREGGLAEVKVTDANGQITPPKPPQPETFARTMRRWHDGTGMGVLWQTVIFIGGLIPALLAVTGIIMWLRSRRWRGEVARRKTDRRPLPAE